MNTVKKRFAGYNCIPNSLCEQKGCEVCEYAVALEEEQENRDGAVLGQAGEASEALMRTSGEGRYFF